MRIAMLLAYLLLTMDACTIDGEPKAHLSNPERVTDIKLIISPDNLANLAAADRRGQLAEQISRALSSCGYPVKPLKSQDEAFTNTLEGQVGRLEKKSTPPGLSLDFGNSDPRALDFQKAEVVSVACVLRASNKTEDTVKLTGEFSLPANLDDVMGPQGRPAPLGFYADRIATVCLNLLSELNIPKTAPVAANTPWRPAVDIEVRDKPPASSPAKPAAPEGVTPVTAPAGDSAPSPAATESAPSTEDKRKQLIIRNLGTPVILEFGYERQ